jgi:hypothetical protein
MKRLVRNVAAALVLASPAVARSEPTFPPIVDSFIDEPGRVEAMFPATNPPGCDLCHVNGSTGGLPLTTFGSSLGIQSTVPTTDELMAALSALQSSNPRELDDLKMSKNPNDDQAAVADALPVPDYGCALAPERAPSWSSGQWLVLVGLAIAGGRRRATRSS